MLKSILLSVALTSGATTICHATVLPLPLADGANPIIKVAEDCGDRRWRDEYGHCHWFKNQYGNDRGTHHACPTWAHWDDGRCLPN